MFVRLFGRGTIFFAIASGLLLLRFNSSYGQGGAPMPRNEGLSASYIIKTKPLNVGDHISNIELESIYNYAKRSANLFDFNADIIILDFWATSCIPCVAALPVYDSLQKELGPQRVQIIPVTREKTDKVMKFMNRRWPNGGFSLPFVTGDTILAKMFPHLTIPHEVWIDKNGKVRAITTGEKVTRGNILKMVVDSSYTLRTKQLQMKKLNFSLIDNTTEFSDKALFRSVLTKNIDKLIVKKGNGKTKPNYYNITGYNQSIAQLFGIANNTVFKPERIILEDIKDSTLFIDAGLKGEDLENWREKNTYCYELQYYQPNNGLSNEEQLAIGQNWMKEELRDYFRRMFHVDISVQKRPTDAFVITVNDKQKLNITQGELNGQQIGDKYVFNNIKMSTFIERLNYYLKSHAVYIVDRSDFATTFSISLTSAEFKNLDKLESVLRKNGLSFERKKVEVDMLVIRNVNEQNKHRQLTINK